MTMGLLPEVGVLKRYIECYVPTETCNLRCHYCYITLQEKWKNRIRPFQHGPEEIRRALSVERLGGACLLNLCAGGETLIDASVIAVVKELLLEGHYVMLVTNGTLSNRFDELARFPAQLLARLVLKFSFHFLELARLEKLSLFFSNVKKMREAGASFTIELTPSDELIPRIDEVRALCEEHLGVLCHVTIARDDRTKGIDILSELSCSEFKDVWGSFQSDLFEFKSTIFGQHRREFCYAGDWSLYVNLETGRTTQCYACRDLDNIFSRLDRPYRFEAVGYGCPLPHCYNGHAFLTLGTIPELPTPTYAAMRDRVDRAGHHWLRPEMRAFLEQKLFVGHPPYGRFQKLKTTVLNGWRKLCSLPRRIVQRLFMVRKAD